MHRSIAQHSGSCSTSASSSSSSSSSSNSCSLLPSPRNARGGVRPFAPVHSPTRTRHAPSMAALPLASLADVLSQAAAVAPFVPSPLLSTLVTEPQDVATLAESVQSALSLLTASTPEPLRPLVNVVGGDLASLALLSPSAPGLARLTALYYMFLTKPSPLGGLLDFYVFGSVFKKTTDFSGQDFVIRDKLGGGNFGMAYEGLQVKAGETVSSREGLTQEQKRRRVVLKKVNMDDKGVRRDFLKQGTMAKGAAETGYVEAYMCNKISRNPIVAQSCAAFLGNFMPTESKGQFMKGSQWLVWRFESDATLGDALDGFLGEFPACVEGYVLGSTRSGTVQADKRDTQVIKAIFKQVLTGLARLHSIGIVHRDIKPENLIITAEGQVKIIDFGAAVDLCTGVNFNPLFGMLDPRYSPPEELVMPKDFPKSPSPLVAAALAPFAWLYGAPDLFDSYSAGVLFVQMNVPQLRRVGSIRLFNQELSQVGHDLQKWRDTRGAKYDFTLMDRNNKAAWDLATKLVRPRDGARRGRLSVSQALGHRYFLPEF